MRIGHYFLHSQEIRAYKFNSIDEWSDFRLKIDENDMEWFERQANEFAGRFLVPVEILYKKIIAKQDQVKALYAKVPGEDIDDQLILAVSRTLSDDFMVSAEVIKKRIKSEFEWAELKAELLS
jgi:Zn-dependent peptidase ImmA (M78 family)